MKTSRKLGVGIVLTGLMCLGLGPVLTHETRVGAGAALADGPDLPFPGTGNKQAWADALATAKQAGRELEARHFDAALKLDQQAIAKYPYDSHFYKQMGIIHVRRGQPGDMKAGEELFKKAISIKGDDPQYYSLLATILTEEKKYSEARAALVKASQLNPTPAAAAEINRNIQQLDAVMKGRQ
jgi:tetratricopeptide (TPR) repeat protein